MIFTVPLISNFQSLQTKIYSSLLLLSFLSFSAFGEIHTVDNKPNSSAQFSDLQIAIDNSQDGDTILVSGSTDHYGVVNVNKKLVLIGSGYNGISSKIDLLYFENLNSVDGSSGSYASGFEISVRFTADLSDIQIERCYINEILFYNSDSQNYSDLTFNNNILQHVNFNGNNAYQASFSNVLFSNNIMTWGSGKVTFSSRINTSVNTNDIEVIDSGQGVAGVIVKNSLFIGAEGFSCFKETRGMVVENNVFYGRAILMQSTIDNEDSLHVSLTFNNNVTYKTGQDVLQNGWFAVGADNLDTDPLFVDFPIDGAEFSYEHDYHLRVGSPALTASVTDEEIGIYGGAYPWPGPLKLKPKGPLVTELKAVGSPSVPAGGTLEIKFKSVIND